MTEQERNVLIARLMADGLDLSQVQTALKNDHGISLTYMELRMIALDLPVDWEQYDSPKEEEAVEEEEDASDEEPAEDAAATGPGQTSVTLNKVQPPGAMLSGQVTFASGAQGDWYIDQFQRFGFTPKGDAEPTQEDMQEFQQELQRMLQGGAY